MTVCVKKEKRREEKADNNVSGKWVERNRNKEASNLNDQSRKKLGGTQGKHTQGMSVGGQNTLLWTKKQEQIKP